MHLVLGTLLLWTAAAYGSARSALVLGSAQANRARLAVGALVMVALLIALGLMRGHSCFPAWEDSWCFLLSGVLHFGIGDLALFANYRVLGPRLGLLLCLCLAVPVAAFGEWALLGTRLDAATWSYLGVVVIGVGLAVAPGERRILGRRAVLLGLAITVVATCGQGLANVAVRVGNERLLASGQEVSVLAKSLHRAGGGMLFLLLTGAVTRLSGWRDVRPAYYERAATRLSARPSGPVLPWVLISGLGGPFVGVVFLNLGLERSPAGVCQAVLALLPITMIPLAWVLDGDRPSRRSLLGAMIAILGVMLLALHRDQVVKPSPALHAQSAGIPSIPDGRAHHSPGADAPWTHAPLSTAPGTCVQRMANGPGQSSSSGTTLMRMMPLDP